MKSSKIFWTILSVLAVGLLAGGVFWYYRIFTTSPISPDAQFIATSTLNNSSGNLNLFSELLGFNGSRTYLLLFLNNTELRPGGGFIGSYAVAKLDTGRPEILKVEGTEILDYSLSDPDLPSPPAPLSEYLKVEKWYFRDSNWSPDFAISASNSLALYKKEGGIEANNINGVIGITPTVIAKLLEVTGPITVDGMEFTSANLVEKLEYEVEYGYVDKGIDKRDRKNLLADLSKALLGKIKYDVFLHWKKYYALFEELVKTKQVMVYSTAPDIQKFLDNNDWSGRTKMSDGDYLMWVDANLGALKTDLAVNKTLNYRFAPSSTGYIAQATMRYEHSGKIDWRTSRYRTYARVFVPLGSKFIASSEKVFDQGDEGGYHWFGAFTVVNPGENKNLSFTYQLSATIIDQIKNGDYQLLAQKQLGSFDTKLNLALEFLKPLATAVPPEDSKKFGDNRYEADAVLNTDQEFVVKLKN